MRIAIFQMDSIWLQPKDNIYKVESTVKSNAGKFDLLILPEMFNTGFVMTPEQCAEPMEGKTLQALLSLSLEYKIGIIGSIPTEVGNEYYNRFYLIDEGLIIGHYDKNYLFSPADEDKVYSAGNTAEIMDFRGVKIQPQICYDIRFPELLYGKKGIDLLVNVSNWPTKRISHYNKLLVGRAVENQCYVIGVNRTGIDGNGWEYSGGSKIVDYQGEIIVNLGEKEVLQIKSIDIEACRLFKKRLPFLNDKKAK